MKRIFIFLIANILTISLAFSQAGVSINTNEAVAADCAILDISSSTQGVLIPRVTLTSIGSFSPIAGTGVTSLLVYNDGTQLSPAGFYYWDGGKWALVGANGPTGLQGATGAAGTNGSNGVTGATGATGSNGTNGTNGSVGATGATGFLGAGAATGNTTFWDGSQWVLSSSNIYNAGGNVGIGTTSPGANLGVVNTLSSPDGIAHFFAPNLSNGSYAQIRVGKATGTYNTGTISYVPNATASLSTLRLGLYGSSDALAITGAGNVGIGTTNPGQKLSVAGIIESTTGGFKFPDGTTQTSSGGGIGVLAWVSFNGLNGSILASYNVSSVTTIATGQFQINFSTALSNANYAVSGACQTDINGTYYNDANECILAIPKGVATPLTTTSARITAVSRVGTYYNGSIITVVITGSGGVSGSNYWSGSGQDIYFNSGNVGIGTSSPMTNARLDVRSGRTYLAANSEVFALGLAYNSARASAGQFYYMGATDNATPDLIISNVGGGEKVRITNDGKVGIGATIPISQLDLSDGTRHTWFNTRSTAAQNGLAVGTDLGSYNNVLNLAGDIQSGSTGGGVNIAFYAGASSGWQRALSVRNSSSLSTGQLLLMPDGGNVGIGTTSPGQKLSVAGTIESTTGGVKFPDGTTQTTAAATVKGSYTGDGASSKTITLGFRASVLIIKGGGTYKAQMITFDGISDSQNELRSYHTGNYGDENDVNITDTGFTVSGNVNDSGFNYNGTIYYYVAFR